MIHMYTASNGGPYVHAGRRSAFIASSGRQIDRNTNVVTTDDNITQI